MLKGSAVTTHAPRAPTIKQVDWFPPSFGWLKCNTDGAAKGCPGHAGAGGIFRNSLGDSFGCFSSDVGITSAFHAELSAVMIAIELAFKKGWKNIWFECDSTSVVASTKYHSLVPWKIRVRWRNCMMIGDQLNLIFTHIFREGNHCADKLASFGASGSSYTWWDNFPDFVKADFYHDKLGLPQFRFR